MHFLIGFLVVALLMDRLEKNRRRPADLAYYYGSPGAVKSTAKRGVLGTIWFVAKSLGAFFLLLVLLHGVALMTVLSLEPAVK